jgi:hypothetical protein
MVLDMASGARVGVFRFDAMLAENGKAAVNGMPAAGVFSKGRAA